MMINYENKVEEKIEKVRETNAYQRIDDIHPCDFYVGFDQHGHKSMAITGLNRPAILKSTKMIRLEGHKRYDGQEQLVFSLLDDTFSTLFFRLCEDLIESSRSISREYVLQYVNNRWNFWRRMLSAQPGDMLGPEMIKGLIGELLFLRDYLFNHYTISNSVNSWMGTENAHKDFEIEDAWYEIKSTDSSSESVRISSISQLDSEYDGFLIVMRLDKTSTESDWAISLNKLVLSILNIIRESDIADELVRKLEAIGYYYDMEYDNICFHYCGRERYIVEENFPRIKSCMLPVGIVNVKYSIQLSSINEFLRKDE